MSRLALISQRGSFSLLILFQRPIQIRLFDGTSAANRTIRVIREWLYPIQFLRYVIETLGRKRQYLPDPTTPFVGNDFEIAF